MLDMTFENPLFDNTDEIISDDNECDVNSNFSHASNKQIDIKNVNILLTKKMFHEQYPNLKLCILSSNTEKIDGCQIIIGENTHMFKIYDMENIHRHIFNNNHKKMKYIYEIEFYDDSNIYITDNIRYIFLCNKINVKNKINIWSNQEIIIKLINLYGSNILSHAEDELIYSQNFWISILKNIDNQLEKNKIIEEIPECLFTEKYIIQLAKINPDIVCLLNNNFLNEKIISHALLSKYIHKTLLLKRFSDIPTVFLSDRIIKLCVSTNLISIEEVPTEFINKSLYMCATRTWKVFLDEIPDDYLDQEMYEHAFLYDACTFDDIPEKFRSDKIYEIGKMNDTIIE